MPLDLRTLHLIHLVAPAPSLGGCVCAQILASKLDAQLMNFWLAAPFEPFSTTLWRGSNRRMFTPNPLAYYPQMETDIQTQYMVSNIET